MVLTDTLIFIFISVYSFFLFFFLTRKQYYKLGMQFITELFDHLFNPVSLTVIRKLIKREKKHVVAALTTAFGVTFDLEATSLSLLDDHL